MGTSKLAIEYCTRFFLFVLLSLKMHVSKQLHNNNYRLIKMISQCSIYANEVTQAVQVRQYHTAITQFK